MTTMLTTASLRGEPEVAEEVDPRIAKAQRRLKDAISSGLPQKDITKLQHELEKARAAVNLDLRRAEEHRTIAGEVAREKELEAQKARKVLRDAAERAMRAAPEAPVVVIKFNGRTVSIRLSHPEIVQSNMALTAVSRICQRVTDLHRDEVARAKNLVKPGSDQVESLMSDDLLAVRAQTGDWLTGMLQSSGWLLGADRLGLIEVSSK